MERACTEVQNKGLEEELLGAHVVLGHFASDFYWRLFARQCSLVVTPMLVRHSHLKDAELELTRLALAWLRCCCKCHAHLESLRTGLNSEM